MKELQEANDPAKDVKMAAYCIYITLKDQEPNLTLEEVLSFVPADIDLIECLRVLGFTTQKKAETLKESQAGETV